MAIDYGMGNSTKRDKPKPIKRGGTKPQAGKKAPKKSGGKKRGC